MASSSSLLPVRSVLGAETRTRRMGSPQGCPVGDLLRFFGRPHVLDILYYFHLHPGPHRFVELQKQLVISPNTLSDRLRDLVIAGFLTRTSYNEIPPRVDYSPTEKTAELIPIFGSISSWARKHDLRAEGR